MGVEVEAASEIEHGAVRRSDARRIQIQRAALEQFSRNGIAATSMANIAEAAGVSRPALYQYFTDKSDIFASTFVGLFEEAVEAALAALASDGELAARLDAFLQRYEGDLWQRMAASPHTDEIADAKDERISKAVTEVVTRLWDGLDDHLRTAAPGRGRVVAERRAEWVEMLRLAPQGFRLDRPSVEAYRRRLSALARTVAADIASVA